MNYLLLLVAIPFLITSIIFLVRSNKFKTKNNELSEKHRETTKKYLELKTEIKELYKPLREGYYEETVNFVKERGSKDFDPYKCIVYVQELDRYTNGESKIQLKKIEVIEGYSTSSCDQAAIVVERKFCTIKSTKDIEWLESEEALKEKRKQKLNSIIEKIEEQEKTI